MISEIYILIAGIFTCLTYFMLVGINKSNKEIFSFSILMVVLNIVYCAVTYSVYNSLGNGPVLFYFGGILGAVLSLNYLFLVEAFFGRKLPYMRILKFLTFIFVLFLSLDLLQSLFTNHFFYLKESGMDYSNLIVRNSLGSMEITIFGKLTGTVAISSSLFSLIYILQGYKAELSKEKYLKLGIYLSFFVIFNDMLVGGADLKGVIPLFFLGYIFEALRFSRYLYDLYKNERDQVVSHIQENSNFDVTNDYTRAFAHDLRGIVRRNSNQLSDEIQVVFDKLTELYCPPNNQKVSLKNAINTALILFQADINDKKITLTKDLSTLDTISNEHPVNSNIVCSIIYGLLQNALAAVQNENDKSILFTVSQDEYFITCIVMNSASNIKLDPESKLPINSHDRLGRGSGLKLMKSLAKSQFIEMEAIYNNNQLKMELVIPH